MAQEYDLSKAVGHEETPQAVSWNTRDLLLYAVGIGAKATDLNVVWEGHPKFAAFPTYPVVLPYKGNSTGVVNFRELMSKGAKTPGLPKLDPDRGVFASQYIEILKPLPLESGDGWKLKKRCVGAHENKSGIVLDSELVLVDAKGTPYARLYASGFNIGAGNRGKFTKSIAGPPTPKPAPKDRKPDWIFVEKTSEEAAVVHRLSGDYNYLHIDPSIGKKSGFGGVILHGLASFGYATRAVIERVAGGDLAALKGIGGRFSSPVVPGDVLETSIWELGAGPDGTVELAFVTKNLRTGKPALSNGIAFVKKAEKSKL
ncbi:Thioesterase/thiol ester dehydrase-isomerase [Exidia glandulosa HHB12029]|uniref:Thioesterase/thiol ester dehydrase-isomerase n=1 Tax=Exidia glandulosa HHB12029 TaxID=1314781 RepID=A0A166BSW2_EXIGL|nr:Thioesterase/thiol ester dehydrase-isomerase [Exidia glandulosa HHB12029]